VEVGTVTPRPQVGNPKPRLFRIAAAEGIINRMGFNNEGHEAAFARLKGAHVGAIVGVNIGANKDSEDFVADYVTGVTRFAEVADYLTINISSPIPASGPAGHEALTGCSPVVAARDTCRGAGWRTPILLRSRRPAKRT
jgi:dihydroorotate dehydrogenase